ncbi:hypothetical protein [Saccharopolyspora dendranthemae]|uniref:Quinol monooxygenase YgiN n=1 Tax=Saccharopolyspora dendranthemae TaxID=1181886 RepID=A0A561V7R1_9PSEU|nr:hypothetical protein [Saccharopolyspora dendranthemae]TWG07659.1 hypothetical protein FHU35_11276 [Saccharopolyspora dendranthemae]
MQHLLMRYRVKPDELERHLELLNEVFKEINDTDPGSLVFISYQLDDPHDFVELAAAPELPGPLPGMVSFQRFRAGLEDRCESRTTGFLHPVGSYGFPS